MSERDGIERAARVAERIEPPAYYREHYEIAELSGFDCAASMIAAAIRALSPAEPDEPTAETMDFVRGWNAHAAAMAEIADIEPDEPTAEMVEAGLNAAGVTGSDYWRPTVTKIISAAMRAARPAGGREGGAS